MAGDLTYSYHGHSRLGFEFLGATPTPTGIVLVFVALGMLAMGLRAKRNGRWLLASFAAVAFGGACIAVGFTYSRGASLALIAGICVIGWKGGLRVNRIAVVAAVSLLLLAIVPSGGARLVSSLNVSDDKAITNRLDLWAATCRIVCANFPAGIGSLRIGEEYQCYYQPLTQRHWYPTPVSFWLNICTSWGSAGIVIAALVVSTFLTLSDLGWRITRDEWCLWPMASMTAFAIAGIFATIDQWQVILGLALTAIPGGLQFLRKGGKFPRFQLLIYTIFRRSLVSAIVLLGVPFVVAYAVPPKDEIARIEISGKNSPVSAVTISQPGSMNLAVVWSAAKEDGSKDVAAWRLARACSEAGLRAVLIVSPKDIGEVGGILAQIKASLGPPLVSCGAGEGSIAALHAATVDKEICVLVLSEPIRLESNISNYPNVAAALLACSSDDFTPETLKLRLTLANSPAGFHFIDTRSGVPEPKMVAWIRTRKLSAVVRTQ